MKGPASRWVLPTLVTVLWGVSLLLPAFRLDNGEVWMGYQVLALGWLGILTLTFAWYANPFIVSILLWWPRTNAHTRLMLSVAVFVLSSTTVILDLSGGIPFDNGRAAIGRFLVGFYLWQLCCVAPLVWWVIEDRRTEGDTHDA
jgi:hypothetical protein